MKSPRPFDWSKIKNLIIRNGWCHARVQMAGQEHWRSLHIEADEFGQNADVVRDALRAFKVQLAQEKFAILQLTKSRNEHSTCAELFAAYATACRGRNIQDETVTTAISRLRHVLKTVRGEFFDIDTARCSIFTADLAREFEAKKIEAVKDAARTDAADGKPWAPELLEQRLQSATNSAKSVLQQARQLFAEKVRTSAAYRPLVLPDLKGFLEYRVDGGTTIAAFVPPPVAVLERITADLPQLKLENLPQWFAFQLAINAGLRRSSARNARWSWCVENPDGSAQMRISRAKGNHSTVTLGPALWAEMKAARASLDYIIPGTYETPKARAAAARSGAQVNTTEPTRDEVIAGLVAWLRAKGLTLEVAEKPFHLLRKIYGDHMRQTHGLDEAQKALGHSSSRLTHAVYSDHRSTKHVRVM